MPPPREILEDISARGGDLLHRTLQSFKPHGNREQLSTSNGEEAEGSVAEEQSISRDDKGDDEESGKRVMRGNDRPFCLVRRTCIVGVVSSMCYFFRWLL